MYLYYLKIQIEGEVVEMKIMQIDQLEKLNMDFWICAFVFFFFFCFKYIIYHEKMGEKVVTAAAFACQTLFV